VTQCCDVTGYERVGRHCCLHHFTPKITIWILIATKTSSLASLHLHSTSLWNELATNLKKSFKVYRNQRNDSGNWAQSDQPGKTVSSKLRTSHFCHFHSKFDNSACFSCFRPHRPSVVMSVLKHSMLHALATDSSMLSMCQERQRKAAGICRDDGS